MSNKNRRTSSFGWATAVVAFAALSCLPLPAACVSIFDRTPPKRHAGAEGKGVALLRRQEEATGHAQNGLVHAGGSRSSGPWDCFGGARENAGDASIKRCLQHMTLWVLCRSYSAKNLTGLSEEGYRDRWVNEYNRPRAKACHATAQLRVGLSTARLSGDLRSLHAIQCAAPKQGAIPCTLEALGGVLSNFIAKSPKCWVPPGDSEKAPCEGVKPQDLVSKKCAERIADMLRKKPEIASCTDKDTLAQGIKGMRLNVALHRGLIYALHKCAQRKDASFREPDDED